MKPLPHTHSCFVCGESNPHGLNLRSASDGKIVRSRFSFGAAHVGFRKTVHGGLTATVLDEVMTWAVAVQANRFAYCAELSVRYLMPVPPQQPLVAEAELVANRRGRIFETRGEIRDENGTVFATATGKYMPLKDQDAAGMAIDFVGDLRWLFEPGRPFMADSSVGMTTPESASGPI